jgi:hypothetical protein
MASEKGEGGNRILQLYAYSAPPDYRSAVFGTYVQCSSLVLELLEGFYSYVLRI